MAPPAFHAVLLAGGRGTRFWPLSRADRPKQMLALGGADSLLAATWKRLRRLAPPRRSWVVAPRELAAAVRAELPELRPENLILEPTPRDTGPAAGLACAAVARRDPQAITGLFPTDHVVRDTRAFEATVGRAIAAAATGALVCLGVRPTRPATGFGYLRCTPRGSRVVAVERFVEKPAAAPAQRFVQSGRYLWNGGMFVWRAAAFLDEMRRSAPRMHRAVTAFLAGDARAWRRAPRLSVDYAVMEHARDVRVAPLDAGWDDLGSWDAAARYFEERGAAAARPLLMDSPGSAVFANGKLVVLVDVPDVVVVDTADALLVVARDKAEKVKQVVERLRASGREDLL
jgi:mannose-1-phosphate guanylyltransferase